MAGKRNPEESLGLVIPVGFLEEEEPGLGFEGMVRILFYIQVLCLKN